MAVSKLRIQERGGWYGGGGDFLAAHYPSSGLSTPFSIFCIFAGLESFLPYSSHFFCIHSSNYDSTHYIDLIGLTQEPF